VIIGGCKQPKPAASVASNNAPATASSIAPAPWFADVTGKSGLQFVHEVGPVGNYALPQIMGSGAALFDFDGDGRLDAYLIQNAGPNGPKNQLFHQEPDGTFRDVSAGSGLDVAGYGMGVAIGDVNNDGLPDVLLCEYGGIRLFLNNGNGTFTEVTREAGLSEAPPMPSPQATVTCVDTGTHPEIRPWPMCAAFVDLKRSGWLDLVVVSYVAYDPSRQCTDPTGKPDYCGPADFPGGITRVYRNLGTSPGVSAPAIPHFQDITSAAGLASAPSWGLGIVAADFDGDGWPDLLIANDGRPNQLWINQHDGTFKNQAVERGLAYSAAGQSAGNMGIALGDVQGDGLFDVYITHLTDEYNALWIQHPRGVFTDRTAAAGLIGHGQGTGFGTVLADFDLDGALDLAVVNGGVLRSAHPVSQADAPNLAPYWRAYAQRNQLFAGDGTGHFRDVSSANAGFRATPNVARGLAYGDIFNDGSVSLLVTTVAGPARAYRNIARRRGHWLEVRAILPRSGGRDAYGATVRVRAGGRQFLGLVNPASSYLCGNDPRVHFGLGKADHVQAIDVDWPDGTHETFPGEIVDRRIVVREGM